MPHLLCNDVLVGMHSNRRDEAVLVDVESRPATIAVYIKHRYPGHPGPKLQTLIKAWVLRNKYKDTDRKAGSSHAGEASVVDTEDALRRLNMRGVTRMRCHQASERPTSLLQKT